MLAVHNMAPLCLIAIRPNRDIQGLRVSCAPDVLLSAL